MKKPHNFFTALSSMDNGQRRVALNLADYVMCEAAGGKQVARVTMSSDMREYSEEEIASEFTNRMDGKARLILGTVTQLEADRGRNFYTALATVNRETLNYEANKDKLTVIASSTFLLEGSEKIWNVEGEGDERRLVLSSTDDLSQILAARRQFVSMREMASAVNVRNDQYVMFYEPASGRMEFGIPVVTARGVLISSRTREEATPIDPNLIVLSHPLPAEVSVAFENPYAEIAASSVQELLKYYRKLYGKTTMWVQLEQAIRQSAAA